MGENCSWGEKDGKAGHEAPRGDPHPAPERRSPRSRAPGKGKADQREGKTHYRMTNRYKRQKLSPFDVRDGDNFLYLNPGSVSIPKEGSAHSYVILEDQFYWKDLEGNVYMTER